MEGFKGFFEGRFVVSTMDLVEVDVVSLGTAEALIHLKQDDFARQAATVALLLIEGPVVTADYELARRGGSVGHAAETDA